MRDRTRGAALLGGRKNRPSISENPNDASLAVWSMTMFRIFGNNSDDYGVRGVFKFK